MTDTMTAAWPAQPPIEPGGSTNATASIGDRFRDVLTRFRETNPTFLIDDDVIRRYHLAMQTRGFVILSGASGTGKTWLAQAYATTVRRPVRARRGRPELVLERGPARLPLAPRRLLPPHAVQRVRAGGRP